ncbi:MAG: RNA polymerase sigma factor [Candidatus Hydrogenedentes bacterium]|nr:RNA polymerase sigma factor [Candidatus Hydrogenedentota bacterium]
MIQTGGKSEAELTSFQAYAAGKRRLLPDADLIERVLAGDRISFDVLVVRHSPLVLGFLSSRLSNVTAAEDLAQEVFLSAYSHLQALRDRSRFVPWLVRIARNRLLDYRRGISRRRETTLPENDTGIPIEEVRDPSPGPADTASNSQVQLAVLEEIARMKERYRAVLFPRLVGEESTEEIARRLGLKVDTTRMRLLRGMRKLRKALTRRGITLEGAAP